jgi:prolipoprotein diacylglyceryltransferase
MQLFSVLLGAGSLAGLLLAGWRAPKKETIRYVDAAVFSMFIALLISRAVYVGVEWGYYAVHPAEIIQVWQGGLSGIGALAGGVLAVAVLAMGWKFPAGVLGDTLLPLAGALSITAWLGCGVGSCAYGLPSNAWWAVPMRDEWGVVQTRLPVQLIGAAATLLITWLVDWASRRLKVAGLSAAIGLLAISSVVFALSYLRADPVPIWRGLRLEAWGAIGLMGLSGCIVVVLLVRWKLKRQPILQRRVT